jgi:hypothetical protein
VHIPENQFWSALA